MQNLLELKGISRTVSDRFSLRDVTLAVEPGQIVGFVGANGAGKSTTLKTISGLLKPKTGDILYKGSSMPARCACLGSAVAPTRPMRHSVVYVPVSASCWTRAPSLQRSRWARSRHS